MRSYLLSASAVVSLLSFAPIPIRAAIDNSSFTYETPREFFGSGDFDGDGRLDIVIVDKETGKYRLGYQIQPGLISWVDCRPSGTKGITGFTVGKLVATNTDAVAFAAPDDKITLVDASSTSATGKPQTLPFTAALGPNMVLAVDAGSVSKTGLMDFLVGSIYNSPDPNLATLVRNDGAEYAKIAENVLPGPAVRGNHLVLKAGQPEAGCFLVTGDNGDTFQVQSFVDGKAVSIATVGGLPSGSDYASGSFRNSTSREFLFYKPGQNSLAFRPLEDAGGSVKLAEGSTFDLGHPVRRVVTLGQRLLIIFGEGETAGVFSFDGTKAPAPIAELSATNEVFTCAANLPEGFVVFTQPASGKFSNKYRVYKTSGDSYAVSSFGSLPSLADNDNITIPDIAARVSTSAPKIAESEMKPYTNTIPGTRVTYAMLPIPAGEFVMGSPANEAEP